MANSACAKPPVVQIAVHNHNFQLLAKVLLQQQVGDLQCFILRGENQAFLSAADVMSA